MNPGIDRLYFAGHAMQSGDGPSASSRLPDSSIARFLLLGSCCTVPVARFYCTVTGRLAATFAPLLSLTVIVRLVV